MQDFSRFQFICWVWFTDYMVNIKYFQKIDVHVILEMLPPKRLNALKPDQSTGVLSYSVEYHLSMRLVGQFKKSFSSFYIHVE